MELNEVLKKSSDSAIDILASDKVDESATLRLPRSVIIQEIIAALSSLSYVASAISPSRPPTYAFIKLLLDAPEHTMPIEGFQEKVLSTTKEMTNRAQSGQGLSSTKNYQLYINILKNAWESDSEIDRSETQLLEALRNELGIWTREHLLLEHHPDVRQLWDTPGAYILVRNYLLNTGLVLSYENNYLIADEVVVQIKRAWGIDLEKDDFIRLLSCLKNEQLYLVLDKTGLQLSGTKEEKIERIINALVPPTELLEFFQVDELRDFCRQNRIQISGRKSEVISNIIDFFNFELDLQKENVDEVNYLPVEPEPRELSNLEFSKLLQNLTNDQLYDLLSMSYLKTSGTKDEKINRLTESNWSEQAILNNLRKNELMLLCKKLFIPISGIKGEVIDRLIEGSKIRFGESTIKAVIEDQQSQVESRTLGNNEDEIVNEIMIDNQNKVMPKGLADVKYDYPYLTEDEQIILALLKETKSLTEQDIERSSRRYSLHWFLTKAHMTDIVAKLKSNNQNQIKVRSVRSINIYEWSNEKILYDTIVNKSVARDVIDALRHGVVPQRNLDSIIIGQSKAKAHLKELLDEAKNNKSPFKFIRGPYGAGKTFLSSWLREQALKENFVVSSVNIGPDQPLSDLPIFYSGLISGIRIPEKTDSCALTDILESWLLLIHRKTTNIEGLTSTDISNNKILTEIVEKRIEAELAYISDLDPGFAPALRSFYRAKYKNNQVLASTAVAWLSGSRSMSTKMLNEIGVRGFLEANQVFPRIRALLEVIKGSRYQGFLLLIDELELIRKFPHRRQREQAFEILRLLIDESGKNAFPGCLIIFTGTDTFFEDDRAGIKSYEALADRIITPNVQEGLSSIRQPVINLLGLDNSTLFEVIKKIRDLHGIAYNWRVIEKFPDSVLQKLVLEWISFGEGVVTRKPRPIIREFIHMLDVCEENPNITHEEILHINNSEKNLIKDITDILN